MANRELTLRTAVIAGAFVFVVGAFSAVAQTQEPKPGGTAEKPEADKGKPAPELPRRDRGARKRDSAGDERPRPDVPVSFPVDI